MDDKKKAIPQKRPSPYLKANWLSRLFFWWMNGLFKTGYKRQLEIDDMYDLLNEDKSEHLCHRLEKEWNRELEKLKSGQKPNLIRAMMRTFGKQYVVMGLVAFFEEATKVLQPLLMGGLIRYFSPGSEVSLTDAYLYAMGVGLCAVVIAISHHLYFFQVQRIGMWLRVASCSLIFKKALRLSNKAFGETTTGQIVNLMSNDVMRFDQSVIFLHYLVIGPLQGIAVLIILWYQLGSASMAGFAILLLLIPVQGFMGRLFTKLRRKTALQTDRRVGLMNEILCAVRVIKMYCWEHMFGEAVRKVRSLEVKRVLNCSYARASTYVPFFSSAKLIAFLTFLVYVLQGHALHSEQVFVALALFNPVRLTLTLFVPFAIQMISETGVTIVRIQRFLLLEELADTSSVIHSKERPKPRDCKVTAMHVTAIWDQNLSTNTLSDINFEVRAGELLAVIGPVGAGKSSLLMALLSELPLSKGSIRLNGLVAFASQQPWVFSASIRENILFGKPYNKNRYQRAVKAAALTRDLDIMPDGDMTLVGERGVSLSGGQKARISLARAVYFEADIYLLDDPLSAVDAAVSKHLFDKCICGVLRDKPRILVTHQLQYLQKADKILILKEGHQVGLGTYDELASGGIDFAALLKREQNEENTDVLGSSEVLLSNPNVVIEHASPSEPSCPTTGDVCHKYGALDEPSTLQLSKSLDSDYLSVLTEVPQMSQGMLSKSMELAHPADISEPLPAVTTKPARLAVKTLKKNGSKQDIIMRNGSVKKSLQSLPGELSSLLSLESLDPDIKPDYVPPKQAEEDRAVGSVTTKIYVTYFHQGAGVFGIILFVLLNVLAQGTYILADWWLSVWSTVEERKQVAILEHEELLAKGYNETNVTIADVPTDQYLYIYTGITISVFLFGLLRALHVFYILVNAAKHLHNKMFDAIIRCPVLFFDTNPVGRILNRFSKDLGAIDETLPLTMFDFIQCALMIIGIVLVAGILNPWVFIPTFPLGVLFIFIRRYYLNTSRDIKRLEATTRSPVFSLVSSSLQGLHTLRAYGVQQEFTQKFDIYQNQHSQAWYLFLCTSRWLAVRLDWLCATFIFAVALCSVLAATIMNGGLVGLSLTYAIGLTGLFQWGVRQSAEVENQMTAVERAMEYSKLPPEAPLESAPDKAPPSDWPQKGQIQTKDVYFRYTKGGVDVLRHLNFYIQPKEKVGIVGRTGAGKSSLIAMLFRLAEPQGVILIDDINIQEIGLHDLRQKISIIPQDPVLFTGSVRRNLDPFSQHTDVALWNSLEEVQLKAAIEELPGCLDFEISEGGVNFSVGQRQLLCLARAILKRNKILIIDEATANVDLRTDSLIQQTIRHKFRDCTVLTIAHRLNTIMDSDRVMVLENGELKEFDEPFVLLQNSQSLFCSMVQQVGHSEFDHLLEIAKDAHFKNLTKSEEVMLTPPGEEKAPPAEEDTNEMKDTGGPESTPTVSTNVNTDRVPSYSETPEQNETTPLNVDI